METGIKFTKTGVKVYKSLDDNVIIHNKKSDDFQRLLEKCKNLKFYEDFLSENSEDALTFSVFHTLNHFVPKDRWLFDFFTCAINNTFAERIKPYLPDAEIKFWQEYSPPISYLDYVDECNRRRKPEAIIFHNKSKMQKERYEELFDKVKRKLKSNNKKWEGDTQVDVEISIKNRLLVFVEAKLDSDISPDTVYDSTRNQIIRILDVGVEQKKEQGYEDFRFILLTSDKSTAKSYGKYLLKYRGVEKQDLQKWEKAGDTKSIKKALPHRKEPEEFFENLTTSFGWLTWADMFKLSLRYFGDSVKNR